MKSLSILTGGKAQSTPFGKINSPVDILASGCSLCCGSPEKKVTDDTRARMMEQITRVGFDKRRFEHTVEAQNAAFEFLIDHQLYLPPTIKRDVRSKYSIRNTNTSTVKGSKKLRDTLGQPDITWSRITRYFQCACGRESASLAIDEEEMADSDIEGQEEALEQSQNNESDGGPKRRRRQIPWKDVGCISWVKVVSTHTNVKDEELRDYAIKLVMSLTPLTQLQIETKKWAKEKWGADAVGDKNYRYRLTRHDSTSIYRTCASIRGIPQRSSAEENLDRWFRTDNPLPPDPVMTDSLLFYQPFTQNSERLIIVFATPEMQSKAWEFGHNNHILADLTFGFSSSRASLMILMALNAQRKGVPIGMMVFTAKESIKAVHSDYDTKLVTLLIDKWRSGLGVNAAGDFINVKCWKNALNWFLAVIPKGDSRIHTRRHIAKFLHRLINDIIDYDEALAAFNAEIAHFKSIGKKRNGLSKKIAKGGSLPLAFMVKAGILEAARRLGIPPELIPRTTNALESFNARVKDVYIVAYHHGGHLPRLDLWVLTIITLVMPKFFDDLREQLRLVDYYHDMRGAIPSSSSSAPSTPISNTSMPLVSPDGYYPLDSPTDDALMMDDMEEDNDSFDEAVNESGYIENLVLELAGTDIIDASSLQHELSLIIDQDIPMDIDIVDAPVPVLAVYDISAISSDNTLPPEPTGDIAEWENDAWNSVDIQMHLDGLHITDNSSSTTSPSSSHDQRQATAMQEMLAAQDHLALALQNCSLSGLDKQTLDQYTPKYLRARVFSDEIHEPEPFVLQKQSALLPGFVLQPKFSVAPSFQIPPVSETDRQARRQLFAESIQHPSRAPSRMEMIEEAEEEEQMEMDKPAVNGAQRLLPLPKQNLEKRKVSHGIR
ncbi:hypothetical protein C8J56DRAFT_890599 [Mycena floridula]|nr:hypothetical protein C8J56DRAFT_890599 [Mycena floridula]